MCYILSWDVGLGARLIGSTKHAFLLLETISLDGKIAPPHEDIA